MADVSAPELPVYALRLHPSSTIAFSVLGSFTRPKAVEVVIVRSGTHLELLSFQSASGAFVTQLRIPLFGNVKSLSAFRLFPTQIDNVAIVTDSGKLILLYYNNTSQTLQPFFDFPVSKIGMGRTNVGHYLTFDPHGRAFLCAALESKKLVFTTTLSNVAPSSMTNMSDAPPITVNSPLEAHKRDYIIFDTKALHRGVESPIFACIECDMSPAQSLIQAPLVSPSTSSLQNGTSNSNSLPPLHKYIVLYEFEMGINHITRKFAQRIHPTAHLVIPLPTISNAVGGFLVVSEGFVSYIHENAVKHPIPDYEQFHVSLLTAKFPVRYAITDCSSMLFSSYSWFQSKQITFLILQSEFGDLYKIQFDSEMNADSTQYTVTNLYISYFDTLRPTNALHIFKSEQRSLYLFAVFEDGGGVVYGLQALGIDRSSRQLGVNCTDAKTTTTALYFSPHLELTNLLQIYGLSPSQGMITDMKAIPSATTSSPQLFFSTGRNVQSHFYTASYGKKILEIAITQLPLSPSQIFSLKATPTDPYHSYLVLSFPSSTIVLSVEAENVSQITTSGFLDNLPTLHAGNLFDATHLQITPQGLRHIHPSTKKVVEWNIPGKRSITVACANDHQVAIALHGGELIYFEYDTNARVLVEVFRREYPHDLSVLRFSPKPESQSKSSLLFVGSFDGSLHIYSIVAVNPATTEFQEIATLSLPTPASSLQCLNSIQPHSAQHSPSFTAPLLLFIGLQNGILIRTTFDASTNSFSQQQRKVIGVSTVKLSTMHLFSSTYPNAVIAISDGSYLCYQSTSFNNSEYRKPIVLPLLYDNFNHVTSFMTPQCDNACAAIIGNSLRILAIDEMDSQQMFSMMNCELSLTPRKFAFHPANATICAVICSDQNTFAAAERSELEKSLEAAMRDKSAPKTNGSTNDKAAIDQAIGPPRAGPGHWASAIYLLHTPSAISATLSTPFSPSVLLHHLLDENEAAISVCFAQLTSAPEFYLCIGATRNLSYRSAPLTTPASPSVPLHPSAPRHFIYVYQFYDIVPSNLPSNTPMIRAKDTTAKYSPGLRLLHKTEVNDIPRVLAPLSLPTSAQQASDHYLLAGVGNTVRCFRLGLHKLLLLASTSPLPSPVASIQLISNRIFVADSHSSVRLFFFSSSFVTPTSTTISSPSSQYAASYCFTLLTDSIVPKHVTAMTILDADTVACGDKFGNFFVLRLPQELSQVLAEKKKEKIDLLLLTKSKTSSPFSIQSMTNSTFVRAPFQFVELCHIYLSEILTSLQPFPFSNEGGANRSPKSTSSYILATTLSGAIFAFLPFANRTEWDFFNSLETFVRNELRPLSGHDYYIWRSIFSPIKNVIDSETIERFVELQRESQSKCAESLGMSIEEIQKKIEDIRNKLM